MPAPRFRLHRHPWFDAAALVGAVVASFAMFHLTDGHPAHLDFGPDSTAFRAESAFARTARLAEGFGSRVSGTASASLAAYWIRRQFTDQGLPVEIQEFPLSLQGARVVGRNVIARSGGTEPGTIVLLAHYDGQTTTSQGAGDNAAGVGTLIELARVLERRGHRRPIMYVATDAKEWGSIGAARFADALGDSADIIAAVSLDHIAAGASASVSVDGVSQGAGYAPIWLRHAAQEAFAAAEAPAGETSRFAEFIGRAIRLSTSDQGPLVARGIPAINLGVESQNEVFAAFIYHTPGDRLETLDTASFAMLGEGTERLVHAIDAGPRVAGPGQYFEIEEEHVVPGGTLLLAAIIMFLPLAWSTLEAWRGAWGDREVRGALRGEVARALMWWAVALAGLGTLRLLAATTLLPRYELYPATVRDPFVYHVRWTPIVITLLAMVAAATVFAWLRRRLRLNRGHPYAGRAAALATLLVLAIIAVTRNPFAAVLLLLLPAWLWPWVGPTERHVGVAGAALLILVSFTPFLIIPAVVANYFQLGPKTFWYMVAQAAYGAWSPLTVVMFLVAVFAAWRLVGTAAARPEVTLGD